MNLLIPLCYAFQGKIVDEPYPDWVMVIAGLMITAGILPMPIVFILRRCQCLKLDLDIHQGAIRRIDTTVSTKEMIGDVDVSYRKSLIHTSMAIYIYISLIIPFHEVI